jgi:DNA-binding CsgD family transcriptional regulator
MVTKISAHDTRISAKLPSIGTHSELFEPRRAHREHTPAPCPRSQADQFGLTARERDVLSLMVCRQTDAEIADQLFNSYRTVTTHVTHIFDKLDARNRRDAAALAVRFRLLDEPTNT